jgi:putative transposase
VRIRYEYSYPEGGFYMAIAKEQLRQIIKENNIQNVGDIYTLLKDSFKDMMQEMLEAEMDVSIGYPKNEKGELAVDNKRNGYSPKTLKSQYGEIEVDIPRDRNGNFEPKIIPKYQRDISGIEEKVISLYARGMSTRDIHDQLQDIYGIELSAEMVSKITDRIIPDIKEWQSRPLNPIYPFIFMDAIHYKIREDGRIINRAAYIVLGVTLEGTKDILSITIGANETSKFWLGMLNDLKNRGVTDVLFFCVDGLSGFKEAIHSVYPNAQIQRCIIHMLRNSFKYVSYKDIKRFASDFKVVYKSPNEELALAELETLKDKWGKKYPYAISNWESNWDEVSPFFHFSDDIRRIMYTTNIIEGLNRQFRKVTKTKSSFVNDTSLEKILYLTSMNVIKKWTQRYRNWDMVLSQLGLLYDDRLAMFL